MTQRILLVEDEANIAEGLKFNLEQEGYYVVWVAVGSKVIDRFESERFDLVILDIMLPDVSGFELCESIRVKNDSIPILFLSAKNQDSEKIKGFKVGADDYITKPFNLEELLLRVRRLMRRSQSASQPIHTIEGVFTFGPNTIDFSSFEATCVEGKIILTAKEIELLKLFFQNEGQVVSREVILSRIWGYDVYPTTRTIDNFVARLRKYFEPDPKNPMYIHSIRGVGYKFTN